MRYRVQFSFWTMPGGYYYSEWFDTLSEATTFVNVAMMEAALDVHQVEDENGEII